MILSPDPYDSISIRLARRPDEITAAQKLRYDVFYREFGAKPVNGMAESGLDHDAYDPHADHLIVVKHDSDGTEQIVGTYRFIREQAAKSVGRYYTSGEYDISPLEQSGATLLELGRSCVLQEYRTKPVLQKLWEGIADYVIDHNIDLMFGCASLHGTDIAPLAEQLSYLYHFHPCPDGLRPRALDGLYTDMNIISRDDINPRKAFAALPPLIKGYLRVGATIGDGAVIDHQFNTVDVCIVVQTHQVTQRYKNHYERKLQKTLPDNGFEGKTVAQNT